MIGYLPKSYTISEHKHQKVNLKVTKMVIKYMPNSEVKTSQTRKL